MAIEEGTETITYSKQRRTWRVNIETPLDADPVVSGYREAVKKNNQGELVDSPGRDIRKPMVQFSLSQVMTETITLTDGTVLTGAQMAEAISKWIDTKDQEALDQLDDPPIVISFPNPDDGE